MTVQAMSWVLDHSTATGGERLVLIAMANHYSRGGECFPSLDTLALESRLSRSAAIRAVQRLEEHDHILVTRAPRAGRSNVNHYRILGFEEWSRNATLSEQEWSRSEPEMVAFDEINGRARATRTKKEPNTEPKRLSLCPEPFVIDEELREWGKVKAPGVDLDALAVEMVDWSRSKGKKHADWRRTLQTWARDHQSKNGQTEREWDFT